MRLDELLSRLHVERGPTGRGEYICRCPAHDDQHASLWVREGDKGIIMKCQAGCTNEAILHALGLQMSDLFEDSHQQRQGSAARRSGAQRAQSTGETKESREARGYDSYQAAYGRIGKLVCCYQYTDSTGKLLFEVARINTDKGKTFRQHRPLHPEQGLFPIVCNVPAEIRSNTIYRQPQVEAAIKRGETVYVVEGEKDADTLEREFGYCGTTSPMGADHWTAGHAEHLRGADVVVIPDADASGEKYKNAVVDSALAVGAVVRVANLRDAYPRLPDKGDISDLVQLVGANKAKLLLDDLVAKSECVTVDLYKRAIQAYNSMSGYCVSSGCICQDLENAVKVLCTFVALPVRELTKDDGANVNKWLEIMGWTTHGEALPKQLVPMNKFKSMDWATEGWGLAANIMPGNTVRDRLRSVITAAGAQVAERKTIYAHTGWRRIDGKWAYLYEGGCIGAQGVSVEMERDLAAYTLDGYPEGFPIDEALMSHLQFESVIAPHVSVPLWGVVFLSPLREFLHRAGNAPAFITLLRGPSGSKKSTAAALALSYFGNFTGTTPPASFGDTTNSLRRKAFVVKDMPLLIDDYHPSANIQERRKMEQTAQALARAFGNLTSRGRLSSDLTIQMSMPPRSLAIMTGEELPDIGDSGIARYYVVEVEEGDVPGNDKLTELQQAARAGELRLIMRSYIEWLLPQADKLPAELGEMFLTYRSRAAELFRGTRVHGRTIEAVAQLMIGLTYMLRFYEGLGISNPEITNMKLEEYWIEIIGNSAEQIQTSRDESAVQMFMRAVSELLTSKTLAVMDINADGEPHPVPTKGMCGYADKDNYYFMAETVYGGVVHFYKDQDRVFPASKAALFKLLRDRGIVEQTGGDGKTTKQKRTPDGKNARLLWIPRWRIDGGNPPPQPAEQVELDMQDDQDLPF